MRVDAAVALLLSPAPFVMRGRSEDSTKTMIRDFCPCLPPYTFIILQVLLFEGLLPSYYNRNKFMSFVRQLNFYGEYTRAVVVGPYGRLEGPTGYECLRRIVQASARQTRSLVRRQSTASSLVGRLAKHTPSVAGAVPSGEVDPLETRTWAVWAAHRWRQFSCSKTRCSPRIRNVRSDGDPGSK